uniref:NSL1 component of MIS12 kinetochore complex n=1 Tax=Latimeria chalumnae TaxID=7897 RepID=H3A3V4_LATCH
MRGVIDFFPLVFACRTSLFVAQSREASVSGGRRGRGRLQCLREMAVKGGSEGAAAGLARGGEEEQEGPAQAASERGGQQDDRVRCYSKRSAVEALETCAELLQPLLDKQQRLPPDKREAASQDLKKELYHPNIKPREIKADAAQGSRMTNVLAAASAVCKQTSEAMKSLPVLIEKAEGLSECLRMQPILERSKVHQEVFSAVQTKDDDKANGFVMQLEVTPTEAGAQIKRELRPRTKNSSAKSPQSRLYPLRSKRQISLTE